MNDQMPGPGTGVSSDNHHAQDNNLLTLHGLYYSTHGGFWEWAPPCNHFRMPYWQHMDRFVACVE